MTRMKTSVIVCAYNDAKNIGRLLDSLQKYGKTATEIIVVISGCTDSTERIVRSGIKRDNRIKLIVQKKKEGKASAINLAIKKANGEVLILLGGDTLIDKSTIQELLKPFSDEKVGIVGSHPVPVDKPDSFVGFFVNFQWKLHHEISLRKPKIGGAVAFRNVIGKLPEDTAVDDAYIEAVIIKRGYRAAYAPAAILFEKGPSNLSDLVKQRKRIHIGYLDLARREGYKPSTLDYFWIAGFVLSEIRQNPLKAHLIVSSVLLETYIRFSAYLDYNFFGVNPYNWEICESTKDLKRRETER